jgi:DNA-binding IclR family transcriptional regulator
MAESRGSELDRHRHRTVDRISQVLELVAGRHEGTTLSELAKDVSAPVSSMQGLVNGLVATGFLDRNGSRYFLGPAPYVLTLQARQNMSRLVQRSDLATLAEDGGYTVLFAVRIGDDAVTIDEAGNQPLLQYLAKTRQRVPLRAFREAPRPDDRDTSPSRQALGNTAE